MATHSEDDSPAYYVNYLEKVKVTIAERLDPEKRRERFAKFEDRLDKSDLTREDYMRHGKGKYLTQWKGVLVLKSHYDYLIRQLLIQEIKPATLIEIGSFNGGCALWMADLMKIHDIKSHVYTMDIDLSYLDPKIKDREDITAIKGDSNKIEEAFTPEFLKTLPHPWLITEDCHINVKGVLEYFDKFTQPGDYIVVEDTNPSVNTLAGCGLLSDVEYEPTGEAWKLEPFKEFMKQYGHKYRVDTGYTDLYGYNATDDLNSILCKVSL